MRACSICGWWQRRTTTYGTRYNYSTWITHAKSLFFLTFAALQLSLFDYLCMNDDDNQSQQQQQQPRSAYALVLSGNHVYTSGAGGTHAATIRGALRAESPDLLTVVLPQSLDRQTKESQKLLQEVEDVVEMPQNNDMSLDIASRICNSYMLSLTDQLISFAFHESSTVIEATKEAKKLDMLVTVLYLD